MLSRILSRVPVRGLSINAIPSARSLARFPQSQRLAALFSSASSSNGSGSKTSFSSSSAPSSSFASARTGLGYVVAAGVTLAMTASLALMEEDKKGKKQASPQAQAQAAPAGGANLGQLNPKDFIAVQVTHKIRYNHNTVVLFVRVPGVDAATIPTMPVSSFVLIRVKVDGKDEVRPYTPTCAVPGGFALMIKSYEKGKVSPVIASLKSGDTLDVKGPIPKIPFDSLKQNVGMIAGGSGLTPMLQVLTNALTDPKDTRKFSLIYANVTPRDIWQRRLLSRMQRLYPDRLSVHFVVQKPAFGTRTGFVTKDLIAKHMPPPSDNTTVLVCGSPSLYKTVSGTKTKDYQQGEVDGFLKELNYTKEQVFKF